MDIDALEITKINFIRKYEENAYLLGNIFSKEKKKNNNNNILFWIF
jgi:CRISPR/Cas system-associated protein endoribonuclease Cas2